MSAPDGFLSRWSRRKLEAETLPDSRPAQLLAEKEELAHGGPEPEPEPELSAEDVAALPRIEDLTADTDLTQFLRTGVPALLRKEALRRMWALDPAIRDFVGEARDYSYDWNVAGGVPVSGPLLPGDDVEATLGRMFSRLGDDLGAGAEPQGEVGDRARITEQAEIAEEEPFRPCEEEVDLIRPAGGAYAVSLAGVDAEPAAARDQPAIDEVRILPANPSPEGFREPAGRPRRHGSARPKLD